MNQKTVTNNMPADSRFPLFGMNAIGTSMFLIRAKDNKRIFVHKIDHLSNGQQQAWCMKVGETGAAIFTKQQADEFMGVSGRGLEVVPVIEVVGTDYTMN